MIRVANIAARLTAAAKAPSSTMTSTRPRAAVERRTSFSVGAAPATGTRVELRGLRMVVIGYASLSAPEGVRAMIADAEKLTTRVNPNRAGPRPSARQLKRSGRPEPLQIGR